MQGTVQAATQAQPQNLPQHWSSEGQARPQLEQASSFRADFARPPKTQQHAHLGHILASLWDYYRPGVRSLRLWAAVTMQWIAQGHQWRLFEVRRLRFRQANKPSLPLSKPPVLICKSTYSRLPQPSPSRDLSFQNSIHLVSQIHNW